MPKIYENKKQRRLRNISRQLYEKQSKQKYTNQNKAHGKKFDEKKNFKGILKPVSKKNRTIQKLKTEK